MAKTADKVINALCQNKDYAVLMSLGATVDVLFEDSGVGDIWKFLKDHYIKYRAIPSAEILEQEFKLFDAQEVVGETGYYLDQLREEYKQRQLEEITLKLKSHITKGTEADRMIQGSIKDLLRLSQMSFGSQDIDITDFDKAAEDYAETRRIALENGGTPGIPTGIDFIDATYTSGLVGGDLVIVLGWTGRAKSLFTTLLSCNAFAHGYRPMIISLEMDTKKVRDRAYTIMGNGLFKNSDLAVGDISEDDFRSWSKKQTGKGFNVISHDGNNEVTPALVQSKIDQYKPDLIVLDYAQLMTDNNNSGDMTARMRNMSREYKALAVANKIPIILISSATPDSATSLASPPIIEQVAWSKQLAFDADLAIAVHKHDEGGVIEIVCRKNRNGDAFSGYFLADINSGKYKSFFDLETLSHYKFKHSQ